MGAVNRSFNQHTVSIAHSVTLCDKHRKRRFGKIPQTILTVHRQQRSARWLAQQGYGSNKMARFAE